MDKNQIQTDVEHWLDNTVIGLGLCPFAKLPRHHNQVAIFVSCADSVAALMLDIADQFLMLEQMPAKKIETTLIVVPDLLADFNDYLDCLYLAEEFIESQGWQDLFQIASFHPKYQFEGTNPDDVENLTNRSPYPIFHILREHSLSKAIEAYGDTSQIPERNKRVFKELDLEAVDNQIDNLTVLPEPIIMAILAVLVGGILIAIYLPIFAFGSVV